MKKLAILLTVVMVLGLASSAMAADLKFSGKTWFNYEKFDLDENGTWSNGYRIQLDGTLDENSGFQIRYEGDGLLKRANYWVNIGGAGKLVAGKQNVNYSVLDQLTTQPGRDWKQPDPGEPHNHFQNVWNGTSFLSNTFTGVSFAPTLPEGFKAVAFFAPDAGGNEDKNLAGVEASADFGMASIYGGLTKVKGNEDSNYAVGVKVPLVADTLSVYAEYGKEGEDNDCNDEDEETVVGAKASFAGFDFIGEYGVESEVYMLEMYKTIGNVEFNAVYLGNLLRGCHDEEDSKFILNTTLYF